MRARMLQHGLEATSIDAASRRAGRSRHTNELFWIVVALLALVIAFCGCETTAGTSAVHGDISRVQEHIQEAQSETDVIEKQNARAAEITQRIRDKEMLIDRWHETHKHD